MTHTESAEIAGERLTCQEASGAVSIGIESLQLVTNERGNAQLQLTTSLSKQELAHIQIHQLFHLGADSHDAHDLTFDESQPIKMQLVLEPSLLRARLREQKGVADMLQEAALSESSLSQSSAWFVVDVSQQISLPPGFADEMGDASLRKGFSTKWKTECPELDWYPFTQP